MYFKRLLVLAFVCCLASPVMAEGDHICFSRVDADGDGMVTAAEFKKAYPEKGDEFIAKLDKNQDGKLDHDEYHEALGHGSLEE